MPETSTQIPKKKSTPLPPPSPSTSPPLLTEILFKFKEPIEIVSKLKEIEVINEDISFPKIVVFGDENVGTDFVISHLTGTYLPAVSVPRILEFKKHSSPSVLMEYQHAREFVSKEVSESLIKDVNEAVSSLLEEKNGESEPITFVLNQKYISGLTIVDIPGIRVLEDAKDQEREINLKGKMMQDYCQGECVFIHVISASRVHTCQSLALSGRFDEHGKRTVLVFTKNNDVSGDSLHNFTTIMIDNPLGFVFLITNNGCEQRIGKESEFNGYVEANSFGVTAVSERVVKVMNAIIFGASSVILKKVKDDIEVCGRVNEELKKEFNTFGEAYNTMLRIVSNSQQSLEKLTITQNYHEYLDEYAMYTSAYLMASFYKLKTNLNSEKFNTSPMFLLDEISILNELNWLCPTNVMSSNVFSALLDKQILFLSKHLKDFSERVSSGVEITIKRVVRDHAKPHDELMLDLELAVGYLIQEVRGAFDKKVQNILTLEKEFPFVLDPDFEESWSGYKLLKKSFLDMGDYDIVKFNGFAVDVRDHKKAYPGLDKGKWDTAFDLKMFMVSYWDILTKRLVDQLILNMMCTLKDMVNGGMVSTMMEHLSIGKDRKLIEAPVAAVNRVQMKNRLNVLGGLKAQIEKLVVGIEFLL